MEKEKPTFEKFFQTLASRIPNCSLDYARAIYNLEFPSKTEEPQKPKKTKKK